MTQDSTPDTPQASQITPLAEILAAALLRAQFRVLELEAELDRCHTCRHYTPTTDPDAAAELFSQALEELAARLNPEPEPEDQSP